MSAHTPGPWVWWTSNSWKRLKRDDIGITQNVMEPYVCSDGHPDCTVSDADMRLIAAAPDLLEALKRAVEIMDPSIPGSPGSVMEDAKAAIAKAEGKP